MLSLPAPAPVPLLMPGPVRVRRQGGNRSPLSPDTLWFSVRDGDPRAFDLYKRHYSFYQYKRQRTNRLIIGPGEKMVLLTYRADALFAWRKFIDDSGQVGVNCAVFRNESGLQSSRLIKEAMRIAWQRWPGERLYTYVHPGKIKSSNPGYCFKKAGWQTCGETKGGLIILEALPKAPAVIYGFPPLYQRAAPHFVGQGVYVTTRTGTFVCDPRRLGEAFAAVMALEPQQLPLPWAACCDDAGKYIVGGNYANRK